MAFALLLLMSMTLLLRVETTSSTAGLIQLQTRESARLALMMAIGELQRHAGPDHRVTARAEITGGANPFWTGVWDTRDPAVDPRWLVSWQDQSQTAELRTMQLVGPGSTGPESSQYVFAPTIAVNDRNNLISNEVAWWISDEGVKASLGEKPLHLRRNSNFIEDADLPALSTMLTSSQGLEEIFTNYNRFTSNNAAALDRITTVEQLLGLPDFQGLNNRRLSGENVFHTVTPYSLGVLASVLPDTNGGLMQDLSLFPKLISPEFEKITERAAATAKAKASSLSSIDVLRHFADLSGLDDLGALEDGVLASPATPILTNFMMAFTIRSQAPVSSNPNFYLRMRFFCEFWNPFTSSLRTKDSSGNDLDLELEITGLPSVVAEKTTGAGGSSPPISLQDLLKDPANANGAAIIRLRYDHSEDWLPGQAKNWTGVDATTATEASPYDSILTDSKAWYRSAHNLGGSIGIDTGISRLSGNVRHVSTGTNQLNIHIYAINEASGYRSLLSVLEGIEYNPVSTRPAGYSSTHSGTTFGYHFILRGPHLSAGDPEYYRGRWLRDHDPRNPKPTFNPDWHLDNDPMSSIGSAYVPIKDGISPLILPDPAAINETESTLNTVIFRRVWDRSRGAAGAGSYFNQLWQDAPLFELQRERPLSLASLQHLYFHNERPFKVGNSWGNEGAIQTLDWFDRYYFSGLSRSDNPYDYGAELGLPNPVLLNYDFKDPPTALARWQAASSDDKIRATELGKNVLVRNRFNLNSTSVAAWKAVLGGLRIHKWDYLDYPDNTAELSGLTIQQDTRARMFARFSQSLSETYDAMPTPAFEGTEPIAPSAYYRRGARHFDSEAIEALSAKIVSLIKVRGEPFYSMREFLSPRDTGQPSLLEESIASVFASDGRQKWDHLWETAGIRGAAADLIDIDHFSPGFLTQADVMTAIGPILSPRSDTFKIRARGKSYSPQGDITGSATLEATLQRTPEVVNPIAPGQLTNERKLELVSIRWLSDEEI